MVRISSQLSRNLAFALRSSETPAFELRFSQIQNTVIRRLNAKINKIVESDNIERRREVLISENKDLRVNLDKLEEYIFLNEANAEHLQTALATAATLLGVISRDDADTNVTASEVADFEGIRNKLAKEIDKLHFVIHPDLLRPDLIMQIIGLGQELLSKNLVEGVVDVEGTVNTTTKNRPIQDFVQTLSNKINDGIIVTVNTVINAKGLRFSAFSDIATNQANRIGLVKSEEERKKIEVEQERDRAAILLQVISLSFEIRKIQTQELHNSLIEGWRADPGSILSILT